MSLNWREIHRILEELSLSGTQVQRILQPDFHRLVLDLYRPRAASQLLIVLKPGVVRLHTEVTRFSKPKVQQRFATLLNSRLKGARVVSAYQYDRDRIVRIEYERASERGLLWLRLWSGAANIVLTDMDGSIVDAYFRRPARNEISGALFELPHTSYEQLEHRYARSEAFRMRELGNQDGEDNFSFNLLIAAHYAEVDSSPGKRATETSHEDATRRLEELMEELSRRREKTQERLAAAADHALLKRQADLIMGSLHIVMQGASELVTEDEHGNTVRVPLDPLVPPYSTAEKLYGRAKRLRAGAAHAQAELLAVEQEEQQLRQYAAELTAGTVPPALAPTPLSKPGGGKRPAHDEQAPGLRFQSNSFTILVGRTARDNDLLLRRYVRGNDTWLHARDYPGAYVFIKQQPGKSIPLPVLIDAGELAVHYSKARGEQTVELYYTQVKYLRRAKHGALGLVIPTQEKNLRVKPDPERLSRILAGADCGATGLV